MQGQVAKGDLVTDPTSVHHQIIMGQSKVQIIILSCGHNLFGKLVAQTIKHLPAMRETQVRSLGWESPLEKEMATYSSILAWRIPRTEEPGRLQSMGLQESDTT